MKFGMKAATTGCLNFIIFNFMQSVVTSWPKYDLQSRSGTTVTEFVAVKLYMAADSRKYATFLQGCVCRNVFIFWFDGDKK
jgi:hypothetical protein